MSTIPKNKCRGVVMTLKSIYKSMKTLFGEVFYQSRYHCT